ncbi:MAG: rod shape-determining protein RodA [Candidatus Omnitrophota bacterium]|jgi:rod shape determining protein RodA
MLKKWIRETHWPLVFAAIALLGVGTLFVYSAAYHDAGNYLNKQFFWVGVGVFLIFCVPFIGYRTFLNVSYLLYVFAISSLVLVMFFGQQRLGAQRWLNLGPFIFQPSEFAKLATVLALANYLGSNAPLGGEKKVIPVTLAIIVIPLFLIARQPDLGSSLLFLPLTLTMLFLWGIRFRAILATAILAVLGAPLFWNILKGYQKKRILVFMNPALDPLGSGYTSIQAKIAVGSGGLFGKGFLEGTQTQLQFVPEHHTDFIFCVIGEEWGYVGTVCVLVLYGVYFHSAFQIMQHTTDRRAQFLISGLLSVMFAQIFINIGMTFGLMPVAGLTLPLVSYGGSSLITTAVATGLILSVYKERSIF